MQKINFLNKLPEFQKLAWGGHFIINILSIIVLVLFTISIYFISQVFIVEDKYKSLEQNNMQLITEQTSLYSMYPELAGTESLDSKIRKAKREVQEINKYLSSIENNSLNKGLSNHLFLLAKHTPKELWYENVYIDLFDNNINLRGYSTKSTALPEIIALLGNNTEFKNDMLNIFDLKHEQGSDKISFQIGTKSLLELTDLVNIIKQKEQEEAQRIQKEKEKIAKLEEAKRKQKENQEEQREKLTDQKRYYAPSRNSNKYLNRDAQLRETNRRR